MSFYWERGSQILIEPMKACQLTGMDGVNRSLLRGSGFR